jgi:hypothetical protein
MADFRKQEEKAAQSIKRDQKKQTIVSKPVPGSKNSWADLRKKEEAFEKAQKEKQKKQNNKSASASNNSWADLRKLDEQSMKAFQKNQKSTQQKQKTKPVSASKNSWADLRRLDEQFMKAFEKIQKNQKGKVTTDARKIQNNLTLQEHINKMKQSMKVQGILSKEELYKFPFPQPKVDPKTTAYYKNLQVDKKTQKATKAINSALLDATPIIGSLKAVKELVTGRDAVTGDKTSRLEAALGIFGGGFIRGATKATKAAKAAEEMSEVSKITKGTPKATQGTPKAKPEQVHHFATNKSKTYTPQIEKITKQYGLDLDEAWNKQLMPHQGRHPNAYHEYVLENLKQFDAIAKGDKAKFLKLYEKMKQEIINNPDMLYKDYWKNK